MNEIFTLKEVVMLAFAAGAFVYEMRSLKKDIKRLEQKQDKHNCLIERMVKVEQSAKSAHLRISELKKGRHMFEMLLNAGKELFLNYGGWLLLVYVICRVGIWIIRRTETKKDDLVLDNFASKGVEFALSVMPKNTSINWLKFTANALGKFTEAYVKSKNDLPDENTLEKAKKLIKEIASQKECKELKN